MRKSIKSSFESVNCPNDWEKYILNIFNNYQGEYFDDTYLKQCRDPNYFWIMTKYRKYSLSFYPMSDYERICLVGDLFGALTGGLCDNARIVDSYVPSQSHSDAVRKRYAGRENLNVFTFDDVQSKAEKYDLVVINLEYLHILSPFTELDQMENIFHRFADQAYKYMSENGRILVTAMGYDHGFLKRLFYEDGFDFQHQHSFDPMGNGALVMELSRTDNLVSGPEGENLNFVIDHPYLEAKWIRDNDCPFFGLDPIDQDQNIIEKVVAVELDLLDKLLEVCSAHDLKIYPIYGTLLGAVRNGHVIAGDDDIDMAMPRQDYDRLIAMSSEFDGKYCLQSEHIEDCFYGGYAKLRNRQTTAIHPQNWWKDCCEGISIDIFPLDRCYKDDDNELKRQSKIHFYQRLIYAKTYGYFAEFKDMKLLEWKAYVYMAKLFDKDKLLIKFENLLKKGDDDSHYMICSHYHLNKEDIPPRLPANAFTKTIDMNYEGRVLKVPQEYDTVLKLRYGEGYIWSWGFNELKLRHGFYSADEPYDEYKRKFGGLKNPGSITEPVVAVGDGYLFKEFLKHYGATVNVAHLVMLPGEEIEKKEFSGIRVESWNEFTALGLDTGTYRMIICAGDVRRAEEKLIEAGYPGYYIFWLNRNWMLYANQSAVWKEVRGIKS